MSNPWEAVPLKAYESHMSDPQVGQLQALSMLMQRQLLRCKPSSVCVLGVAGGNGLEHIDPGQTSKIYGIDISAEYLRVCAERFAALGDRLSLLCMDLRDAASRLPQADAVIADLVIEYLGAEDFAQLIAHAQPQTVCCAVQQNCGAAFVSASPDADALQCIGDIHEDIAPEALADAMAHVGYRQTFREDVALPGGKQLVCMDFAQLQEVRALNRDELEPAMALVWQVFCEFEAPEYSVEGVETFRAFIEPGAISRMRDTGEVRVWGAFEGGVLRGVIAERGTGHICLFFVQAVHHGRSFGRLLFGHYKDVCRGAKVKYITVNSSPYAVEIYRRLGFVATQPEQLTSGIRYIPMEYHL